MSNSTTQSKACFVQPLGAGPGRGCEGTPSLRVRGCASPYPGCLSPTRYQTRPQHHLRLAVGLPPPWQTPAPAVEETTVHGTAGPQGWQSDFHWGRRNPLPWARLQRHGRFIRCHRGENWKLGGENLLPWFWAVPKGESFFKRQPWYLLCKGQKVDCVRRQAKVVFFSEPVSMVSESPWQSTAGCLGQPGGPKALSHPGHPPRPILLDPKSDRGHRLVARALLSCLPGVRSGSDAKAAKGRAQREQAKSQGLRLSLVPPLPLPWGKILEA